MGLAKERDKMMSVEWGKISDGGWEQSLPLPLDTPLTSGEKSVYSAYTPQVLTVNFNHQRSCSLVMMGGVVRYEGTIAADVFP